MRNASHSSLAFAAPPIGRTLNHLRGAVQSLATTAIDWRVEEYLIRNFSLPLNLDQNRNHEFHLELSESRRVAKARARELPVVGLRLNSERGMDFCTPGLGIVRN